MTAVPSQPPHRRSPGAVRTATFAQKRRGYDEAEVRDFLAAIGDEIQAGDNERAALRAELERMRYELGPDAQAQREEITAHAVGLLSQAQQVADSLVAEAEQYARELVGTARDQQREILERAHATAGATAQGLALAPAGAPGASAPDLEYVRTFAHVAQHQLRSVLEALAEQVDKLGQLPPAPAPGQGVAAPVSRPDAPQQRQDVLWAPHLAPPPAPSANAV